MGDYSYDDHVDLFGGPPEPGEGVDWRDYVDQERKAAKEDPYRPEPQTPGEHLQWGKGWKVGFEEGKRRAADNPRLYVPAPRRPWWRRWRRGA